MHIPLPLDFPTSDNAGPQGCCGPHSLQQTSEWQKESAHDMVSGMWHGLRASRYPMHECLALTQDVPDDRIRGGHYGPAVLQARMQERTELGSACRWVRNLPHSGH